jgi:hypothetical protein
MPRWTYLWKIAAVALPLASGAVAWQLSRPVPHSLPPPAARKPAAALPLPDPLETAFQAFPSTVDGASAAVAYIQTCPLHELLPLLEGKRQPWGYSEAANRAAVDRLLAEAPEHLLRLVASNFGLDVAVRSWVPPHLNGVEVYLPKPPNLAAADGPAYYRALHDGDFSTVRKLIENTQPKPEDACLAAQVAEAGGVAAFAATLGDDAGKIVTCFQLVGGQPHALWDFVQTKSGPLREKLLFKALMASCSNKPGAFAKRFPLLTEDEQRQFFRKPAYSEFLISLEDYDAFVAGADLSDPANRQTTADAMSPGLRLEQAKRDLPEGSKEREKALFSAVCGICNENYADKDSIGEAFREISNEAPALQLKCLEQVFSRTEPFHESLILPLLQQAPPGQLAGLLSKAPTWLWEKQEGLMDSLVATLPTGKQASFQARKLLEHPDAQELRDYFSQQLVKGDPAVPGQLGTWSKGRETEALDLIRAADPEKAPLNSLAVINAWWGRDSEAARTALQTMIAGLPAEKARDILLKFRESDPYLYRTYSLETVPPAAIISEADFQYLIGSSALNADDAAWSRWESQLTPLQRGFSLVQQMVDQRAAQEKLRKLLED